MCQFSHTSGTGAKAAEPPGRWVVWVVAVGLLVLSVVAWCVERLDQF